MPVDYFGKMLFPRLQPWQRRRQIKTMLMVLIVAVIFAAVVAGFMLLRNSRPM